MVGSFKMLEHLKISLENKRALVFFESFFKEISDEGFYFAFYLACRGFLLHGCVVLVLLVFTFLHLFDLFLSLMRE